MIELSLGLILLVVAVLGTMASELTALDLVKTVRERNAAMSDLEACMEEALTLSPDKIPIPSSPFASGRPVAAFDGLHLTSETITPTYPGYAAGSTTIPDPLSIVLVCTWKDWRGRARNLKLVTGKTR